MVICEEDALTLTVSCHPVPSMKGNKEWEAAKPGKREREHVKMLNFERETCIGISGVVSYEPCLGNLCF